MKRYGGVNMNQLLTLGKSPLVHSYESYKQWVKSIPDLSEDDEIKLVRKLNSTENPQESINSAQQLALSQLKTVVKVAEQHRNYGIPCEDLVQEGNIGLLKAIKNYKTGLNTRLYTYAMIWIKSEIQAYIIKNWKIVKAATTNNLRKLFFNFKSTQKELLQSGVPKHEIISNVALKLGVNEDEVREMQNYLIGGDVSLSLEKDDSEDSNLFLEIPDYHTPEIAYIENIDSKKLEGAIHQALNSLKPKQREVLELRFFTEEKKTHKEISEVLGVSPERVRQIEAESLGKMKKLLGNFTLT